MRGSSRDPRNRLQAGIIREMVQRAKRNRPFFVDPWADEAVDRFRAENLDKHTPHNELAERLQILCLSLANQVAPERGCAKGGGKSTDFASRNSPEYQYTINKLEGNIRGFLRVIPKSHEQYLIETAQNLPYPEDLLSKDAKCSF